MKKFILLIIASQILFSGCATMFGGGRYYAHVIVNNNPKGEIYYKGELRGRGKTVLTVPRNESNKFSFSIKEPNCETKTFTFTKRRFRWVFLFINPSLVINYGLPIPIGIAIDLGTGAFWKPDKREYGVEKIDFKNWVYAVDYKGCTANDQLFKNDSSTNTNTKKIDNYHQEAEIYYESGKSKYKSQHYRDAIVDINKAIELDPKYAKPYNLRGLIKMETNDNPGALLDFDSAIALNKDYTIAYNNRGDVKWQLKDKTGACHDWNKASEFGSEIAKKSMVINCK